MNEKKIPVLVIFSLLLIAACSPTLGVLYNVDRPVQFVRYLNAEEVRAAVFEGLIIKSWHIIEEKPGEIIAEIRYSGHEATIRIEYSPKHYAISHVKSSESLKYANEGAREVIHRRYNHWINLLDNAIFAELQSKAHEK